MRYEDLRANTLAEFARLVGFFGLQLDEEKVQTIVEQNSFEYATKRKPGQEDTSSHKRKGIIGDWRNVFQSSRIDAFKRLAGDLLVEVGYEKDLNW
ncbi:MAG: sulfotransferase domain-containing protein [Ardenticatenaceae bacterium]|nr:sulfotransferase domain-containing protein [Ardenticatenaceae bacterium]